MSATLSARNTSRSTISGLANRLAGAAMLLAVGAQAQTPACDQLKATLAARIKPGGFTLEAVPADTAVSPGAKVVGTCEAGAYKVLLRRDGSTQPSPAADNAAAPASAQPAAPMPALRPAAAPSPGPAPAPQPVARVNVPAVAPAVPAAPDPAPEKNRIGDGVAVRAAEPAVAAPPAPTQLDTAPGATPAVAQRTSALMAQHWRWILALVMLPVVAWAWFWYLRRRDYDEAGLPRGPRL